MNSAEDKAWASRLDRALKELPELPAPSGLVERTLAELDRRQKPVWHKQPFLQWPMWLRAVSLVSMLAALAGAYFAKWEFAHTTFGARVAQTFHDQFSDWTATLSAVDAVGHAALAVARHLNPWVAALCVFVATMAYLACIGLGTAAARLAFSRR
jgi:hypothetical protein